MEDLSRSSAPVEIEPAKALVMPVSMVRTSAPVLRSRTKSLRFLSEVPLNSWLEMGPVEPEARMANHLPFVVTHSSEGSQPQSLLVEQVMVSLLVHRFSEPPTLTIPGPTLVTPRSA